MASWPQSPLCGMGHHCPPCLSLSTHLRCTSRPKTIPATTPLLLTRPQCAPSPSSAPPLLVRPPSLVCFQLRTTGTRLRGLTGKAPAVSRVSTGPLPGPARAHCPVYPQTPQDGAPHRPRCPAKETALEQGGACSRSPDGPRDWAGGAWDPNKGTKAAGVPPVSADPA